MRPFFIPIVTLGFALVQAMEAQSVYLSNLSDASIGAAGVGNSASAGEDWVGSEFECGNNIDGYSFDSVQLSMGNAVGTPSGFSVMLYSSAGGTAPDPGSVLETLAGPNDPSTAGIYTYTTPEDIELLPDTDYFIVVTAKTSLNTSYTWNYTSSNSSYDSGDGWTTESDNSYYSVGTGLAWSRGIGMSQFSVTASAVSEPSTLCLLLLVSVGLLVMPGSKPYLWAKQERLRSLT